VYHFYKGDGRDSNAFEEIRPTDERYGGGVRFEPGFTLNQAFLGVCVVPENVVVGVERLNAVLEFPLLLCHFSVHFVVLDGMVGFGLRIPSPIP
jgi:hypothetical protein